MSVPPARPPGPSRTRPPHRRAGFTLIELAVALTLAGIALAATLPALGTLDRLSLSRAARLTERHLASARLGALADRAKLRVRLVPPATLETLDADGAVRARIDLEGGALRALDSVRIRPASIRFNARGQGSAGSIYLYRGQRAIRVISNFVGRIRRHGFRF